MQKKPTRMLEDAIDGKSRRDKLKAKGNRLFERFLDNPENTGLTLKSKSLTTMLRILKWKGSKRRKLDRLSYFAPIELFGLEQVCAANSLSRWSSNVFFISSSERPVSAPEGLNFQPHSSNRSLENSGSRPTLASGALGAFYPKSVQNRAVQAFGQMYKTEQRRIISEM
jgi:hypothetical protein